MRCNGVSFRCQNIVGLRGLVSFMCAGLLPENNSWLVFLCNSQHGDLFSDDHLLAFWSIQDRRCVHLCTDTQYNIRPLEGNDELPCSRRMFSFFSFFVLYLALHAMFACERAMFVECVSARLWPDMACLGQHHRKHTLILSKEEGKLDWVQSGGANVHIWSLSLWCRWHTIRYFYLFGVWRETSNRKGLQESANGHLCPPRLHFSFANVVKPPKGDFFFSSDFVNYNFSSSNTSSIFCCHWTAFLDGHFSNNWKT